MSTTATLALKACPFCGDTDTKVFGESAPEWWVTCMGCRASSPCRTTRPQAIAGWNRRAALAQRTDPWRQAVDEALIAHALDCTGPGDDPKEKVKELIEWAVTIATDPRVSETAAREQEASATGAEMKSIAYPGADLSCGLSTDGILICGDEKSINRVRNALHAEAETVPALRAELIEARKAPPTTSTTGKVDVEQMLRDCVPGGSSCDPQAICDDIRNWFARGDRS